MTQEEQVARDLESFQAEATPDLVRLPRDIRQALDCIHQHLFDPALNVGAVRSRCGLRNNNISANFRRVVGLGIREYIESLRLEAAAFLLVRRQVEIFLIAIAVGYENHETFCRAFQRFFRCTPSEYRSENLARQAPREKRKRKDQETFAASPLACSSVERTLKASALDERNLRSALMEKDFPSSW